MTGAMEWTVLGCGSSGGTPVIGCPCTTCASSDPKNHRTRTSALIRTQGKTLVIDTGVDFRQQMVREKVDHLDGVLYTHPHADHLHGVDDLRAFCYRKKSPMPVFGNAFMMQQIADRFAYTQLPPGEHWDKPVLTLHTVDHQPFEFEGLLIQPIPLLHGKWPILGWRMGDMAWLTDVSEIPASSFDLLQNLTHLFLDCLRPKVHATHFGFNEALTHAQKIKAKNTWFIHMTHELEYHQLSASLPDGIRVAWDGLTVQG